MAESDGRNDDVDLEEMSQKAKVLAEATGRDVADVMADLLDDGVLNESNKEVKGILDKANEQAEKAKALLMTVLPIVAILLGGGGAEMLGLTDFTGLGSQDEHTDDYDPTWDIVWGCTAWDADNYDQYATDDDGGCYWSPEPIYGCLDDEATNYDSEATDDDGSCEYPPAPIYGCTDENAENYDSEATDDDDSCEYPPDPEDCSVAVENHYRGHVSEDAEQDAMLIAFKVVPDDCADFEIEVNIHLFQNGHAPNYTDTRIVSPESPTDISHVFDDIPAGHWIPKIIVSLVSDAAVEKANVNFWGLDIEEQTCEGEATFYATSTTWVIETNNNTTTAKNEIRWDIDWSCPETKDLEVDIIITDSENVVFTQTVMFNTTSDESDWKIYTWDMVGNMSENYTLDLAIWYQNTTGEWIEGEEKTIAMGRPDDEE